MSETVGVEGKSEGNKTQCADIEINKSLKDLNYKQLQNICMNFNLPANIKHSQMLTMLVARQTGDEDTVNRILSEYREQRCRRRPSRSRPPENHSKETERKTKRRKIPTANRYVDYCYMLPQAANDNFLSSSRQQDLKNRNVEGGRHDNNTTPSRKAPKTVGTSGLETMKLVMEATAARRDMTGPEGVLHPTQPLLRTLLQETPVLPPPQFPGPSSTIVSSSTSPVRELDINMPQNFCTKHPAWPTHLENRRNETLTTPFSHNTSTSAAQQPIYDSGVGSSHLLELRKYNYAPIPQAHDLTIGRRSILSTVPPPSSQFQSPMLSTNMYPERVNPPYHQHNLLENSRQHLLPDIQQDYNRILGQQKNGTITERKLPSSLELVLNMKTDSLATVSMPKFWRSASTNICQCYNTPLCSTFMFPNETEAPRDILEGAVGSGVGQRMDVEPFGTSEDTWWSPGNEGTHIQQHSCFPDFRQNNQLSYPLIYSYLASTEEQLKQQNETRRSNTNFGWTADPDSRPQAVSSPIQNLSSFTENNNFLQTMTDVPQLDEAMLEIIDDQQNTQYEHEEQQQQMQHQHQQELQQQEQQEQEQKQHKPQQNKNELKQKQEKCRNKRHGCRKVNLTGSDLEHHEAACEYQTMECYNDCLWRGRLKHLAGHLREEHRSEILRKAEASHTIPLHEVRARQNMSFLREVNRRMFVITIHCHGHLLYATIQFVPSWKPDKLSLVKASLEVVGDDGRPHSWRGKVRPIYESMSTLWATDQCLTMDPAAIGAFAGANIILHTKITTYIAGHKN